MKTNDVKLKGGWVWEAEGSLGGGFWFMATLGVHLSRHNWLLLTARMKSEFCHVRNHHKSFLNCVLKLNYYAQTNKICIYNHPKKRWVLFQRVKDVQQYFMCLYLSISLHFYSPSIASCSKRAPETRGSGCFPVKSVAANKVPTWVLI